MKITGIIAECNPLHNGHSYLFHEARSMTEADYLVAVISGDYVQRGEPALLDKHTRARMLLQNGVDLVLEMPTVFATGSAEYFARCGVGILHKLGCINALCFGSEDGTLSLLKEKAALSPLPLDTPNNILAIAYLKALNYHQAAITPYTIKRQGDDYHGENAMAEYPSASSLRKLCLSTPGMLSSVHGIPASVQEILSSPDTKYLSLAAFDPLLGCHLQGVTYENLTTTFDIYPDLADKILKNQRLYTDAAQFISCLKSKDIAYSHLSRALLHLVLGYTNEDAAVAINHNYAPYSRILGMKKSARPLMHAIKKASVLPLINKPAKAGKLLDADSLALLQKDFAASHIYSLLSCGKIVAEETKSPLLL